MSFSLRSVVLPPVEALFRILFTYDCLDEDKVPATGPVVVVANHPSYLDPILLSLQVARPIRFMAWNALFRVPVLGPIISTFGAFPVDTRPGRGRAAYDKAKELLQRGEVVGIFPEGRRSGSGWMEPHLRDGAARLAIETGAKLVPATIKGAFRAWPYFRSLPEPARITVRYHDPIDVSAWAGRPLEQALDEILDEIHRRVDKTLLPGVKADLKISLLYRSAPPWPRVHEYAPALGLALFAYWKTRAFAAIWPGYAYVGYCLLDLLVIPPRRLTKWIRSAASIFFPLFYAGWLLPRLGLPTIWGRRALVAVVAGAAFPYLYERGRVGLAFLQGMVLAIVLELAALYVGPTGLGPHVALPLYAAAYAWERRTVFWRWSTPLLLAYSVWVTRLLGGGVEVLPHVIAGLLAWLVVRFLPGGKTTAADEEEEPPVSPLGLGLDE